MLPTYVLGLVEKIKHLQEIPHMQKQLLMNAYFLSKFSSCPLVKMNYNRTPNNRINRLRKKHLVCKNFSLSFSELLEEDKSVTIHNRNLQTLTYEIFKIKSNMKF